MVNGISPRVLNSTQQGNSNVAPLGEPSQIPLDRKIIRLMFPTTSTFKGVPVLSRSWPQTPFRVATNSGDLLMRQHEPGGANQLNGVGIRTYRSSLGMVDGTHTGDGASGNQHYVYDSSVYTKYKRLQSKQSNYNDITFGGANNGAFMSISKMRR